MVEIFPDQEVMYADRVDGSSHCSLLMHGISDAGKYVELIARIDVLALISNCPQLNNPCKAYNPTPIEILIWDA